MKRLRYIICLLICFLTSVLTFAQSDALSVKRFEDVSHEKLYARSPDAPRDNVGNYLALLLIQVLSDSEASFSANYMIKEAEKRGNEYWVYMAEGAKYIDISLPRYEKIRVSFNDASYGSIPSLVSKCTYELVIHVPGATVVPQSIKRQFFKMYVSPEDAVVEVEVDGMWQLWTTEGGVASDVINYGSYRYRVSAPDHHTQEGIFTLDANHSDISVELRPSYGFLAIESTYNTAGASVYAINTVTRSTLRLGTIPLPPTKLSSARYRIKLHKDNYKDTMFLATIQDGETLTLSPTLQENTTHVTLETKYFATIYMDGVELGKGTWTGKVEYGQHVVEVRADRHRPNLTSINVSRTDDIRTYALNDPTPIYGSAMIKGSPFDAKVYIDSQLKGTTPIILDQLLIGKHRLRIEKDGYLPYQQEFTVQESREESIQYTLEKSTSSSPQKQIAQQQTTPTPTPSPKPSPTPQPITKADRFAPKTFTVKGVSFTMIGVQGGTFTMGITPEQASDADSDESPAHIVTVSSFFIGETEVTQELWQAVMGNNPSTFKGAQRPVENITWEDCQAFIKKLNKLTDMKFRLPTEAEWEYAARGGQSSLAYKYAGSNNIDDVAWYKENGLDTTHAVKEKNANELGIYDMSGNVWEWCQDWYGSYSKEVQTNPKGPASGSNRVLRGGSWYFNTWRCRVASRYYWAPTRGINYVGLRLAW